MTRFVLLLVLALVPSSNSYAGAFHIHCHEAFLKLTTREQVRERFGKRITSGVDGGRTYDEVRYHGKPYHELHGPGRGMLFVMTFGLSELILIPRDLCKAGRDIIVGHTIRFNYDESNRVISILIDGEGPFLVDPIHRADQTPPPP